jgi:hypothetical protein
MAKFAKNKKDEVVEEVEVAVEEVVVAEPEKVEEVKPAVVVKPAKKANKPQTLASFLY